MMEHKEVKCQQYISIQWCLWASPKFIMGVMYHKSGCSIKTSLSSSSCWNATRAHGAPYSRLGLFLLSKNAANIVLWNKRRELRLFISNVADVIHLLLFLYTRLDVMNCRNDVLVSALFSVYQIWYSTQRITFIFIWEIICLLTLVWKLES